MIDDLCVKKEKTNQQINENLGVYFVRTNLQPKDEQTLWSIYNTIREIESTFRTLKTDLDLRPIYYKNDESTMAHLHLGLLAYWLVNSIRYQLKQKKSTMIGKKLYALEILKKS
ncbi:MAG: transposase [Lutibacter sp.]|nr:transposase [Lutibacter sp.]